MKLDEFKVGQRVIGRSGTPYEVYHVSVVARLRTVYKHETADSETIVVADETSAAGFRAEGGNDENA